MERKINALLAHFKIDVPPNDGLDEARLHLAQGTTMQAIALSRRRSGASLAEARAAIERGL